MSFSMGHDLERRDPEQQEGGVPVEQAADDYRRVVEQWERIQSDREEEP